MCSRNRPKICKADRMHPSGHSRTLRCRPLPIPHGRQPQRVSGVDPNAVVISENIAKNDRFDLLARQLAGRDLIDLFLLERGKKALHPRIVEAVPHAAETLQHPAARKFRTEGGAGVLTSAI